MAEFKENIKKPLGRGLGSLLGESVIDDFKSKSLIGEKIEKIDVPKPDEIKITSPPLVQPQVQDHMRVWEIDIEKISPNEYQPRKLFVNERLAELANSIKEKGVLQPIIVRKSTEGKFELIAGERRWRAAQLAGLHKIPALIKEAKEQESLELAIIENVQRHDLNPIEEAEAYDQLAREFNLSQVEIAQKVGKERATIANILRLLSLEPSVREMLSTGEISSGHAKVLLALNEPQLQRDLAKKINTEKLTVRAAERLIQSIQKKKKNSDGAPLADSVEEDLMKLLVQDLQETLAKSLGTKVEIDYKDGQGHISIKFYSDEDLTRITDKMKS